MSETLLARPLVRHAGVPLFVDHRPGTAPAHVLALHDGGNAQEGVFSRLREALALRGVGSTAFDCIGHGRTGGDKLGSSLAERTAQARAVIGATCRPTAILGASMGAYNALRLAPEFDPRALVLVVPGVYCPQAYEVPFGPGFSRLIRQPRSWLDSDAWAILSRFTGRLLVIAAEDDEVVPLEIPQRLHAAAVQAQSRSLLVVPGAPHSGLLERMLSDPAWRERLLAELALCLS